MCVEYCIVCARSQCAYIYRLHCSLSRCLIECTVCILYPHGLYCSMFCVYWKCACSLLFYFSFVSWVFCLVLFCSVAFAFVWKVQAQSCIVNLFESFPADWVFLQFLFILHLLLFFVLSDLLCAKDIIRVAFFVLLIVDCLWTCSFSFFLLFFFPLRRVFFFSVRSCLVVSYIYA